MEKVKDTWLEFFQLASDDQAGWWQRKKTSYRERGAEIARITGHGHVFESIRYGKQTVYQYLLHLALLIRQNGKFIREEQVIPYWFQLEDDRITGHWRVERDAEPVEPGHTHPVSNATGENRSVERFDYDRRAAVQYAERWWNSYNPEYRKF